MSDGAWRSLRTLLQGLTGSGVLLVLNLFVYPFVPVEAREFLTAAERQAVILVVLSALVSALHNALEASNLMPTVGKVPTIGYDRTPF